MKSFFLAALSATTLATNKAYSSTEAAKSLQLSEYAYCGHSLYDQVTWGGAATGFVLKSTIYDIVDDTNGFIGYLPSDNSIYVVFRGSESILNWVTNLDTTKTAYTSYPDCNCEVHAGFYAAEQRALSQVLNQVAKLRTTYPTAKVKVSGHSLGAALATLTAMDLYRYGYTDVQCYNFGSPRVGDQAFSAFAGTKMTNFWRVTHLKDMVVHNPGSGSLLDFWHVCQEEYEDAMGNVHSCSSSICEDQTCADQWAPWQLNIADHLNYLGMCMGEGCGYCPPPVN